MTIEEYVQKYNGKKIDFDGQYGSQCVDNARQYMKEVLCIPQPFGVRGAKDFWENYNRDKTLQMCFQRVVNDPYAFPESGDIVIWGLSWGGGLGHIAPCTKSDTMHLTCFEQDGTENEGNGGPAHIVEHNYKGILGWFHPRQDRLRI